MSDICPSDSPCVAPPCEADDSVVTEWRPADGACAVASA